MNDNIDQEQAAQQPSTESLVELTTSRRRISRREAMQWVMSAVAVSAVPSSDLFADPVSSPASPTAAQPGQQERAAAVPNPAVTAKGYGIDPNLTTFYKPGAFWPLTFTDAQQKTVESLADVILPKDKYGPAASSVGVVEMIDEWISAPYPTQQGDRPIIIDGLVWLEAESNKRFKKGFADLDEDQQKAICDDICFSAKARKEFKPGAKFFSKFRSLAAAAYYGTPAGFRAIGYVGNVPLTKFDGPPAAVLEQLGVTQSVPD